jgi:alkyl sulfatase BDS1-like metallo-beta-lactamase superfamily hydrolase
MQEIIVPEKYKLQPYFGKVEWTVRGIYHENIGWFDRNPASMYALPPSSIYPELVETAGIEALNQKAVQLLSNEEYIKVLHLTDIVLKSNPDDRKPMKFVRKP